MRRRTVLMGMAAASVVPTIGVGRRARAATGSELVFDERAYTTKTTTVSTGDGAKEVTYRFYRAVPYVADPVDSKYQSLNVSVPVRIDGDPVDATYAPILLSNSVGGYMPSSVVNADGVGGGEPTGAPPGGDGEVASGGNAMLDDGRPVSNAELAVAAGYVVVEPGARGRTLVDSRGIYYGVAPAAIVDLKAAVRYVRHNTGRIPGNTDHIVTAGVSAGGALSALLGVSGDSPLYEPLLERIGAAPASDTVFASGAWCPIADLEHADMAYEWNWGDNELSSGELVDQSVSEELRSAFAGYQDSLGLRGKNGFGRLTADNYDDYLLKTYLRPAAAEHLKGLSAADRSAYLADNPWISWSGKEAMFTWQDYLTHVGARKKSAPAFDAFDLSTGENNLFGRGTTEARHFTRYSLRHATGDSTARLDRDIPVKLDTMNPMHFIGDGHQRRAGHWWIRVGTKDSDTSLTVVGNLAAGLENLGEDVDAAMYWDAGHGANEDAGEFITWIGRVTGYHG